MKDAFIPEATGQAINPAAVPGGLELMFGVHADEARAMIERHKQRPVNRYVQIVKPSERVYRIMSEEQAADDRQKALIVDEVRMSLNTEREAIAQLVETATDAHDLHDIARRIRARKDQP